MNSNKLATSGSPSCTRFDRANTSGGYGVKLLALKAFFISPKFSVLRPPSHQTICFVRIELELHFPEMFGLRYLLTIWTSKPWSVVKYQCGAALQIFVQRVVYAIAMVFLTQQTLPKGIKGPGDCFEF